MPILKEGTMNEPRPLQCPSCWHHDHAGPCQTPSEYGCECMRRTATRPGVTVVYYTDRSYLAEIPTPTTEGTTDA